MTILLLLLLLLLLLMMMIMMMMMTMMVMVAVVMVVAMMKMKMLIHHDHDHDHNHDHADDDHDGNYDDDYYENNCHCVYCDDDKNNNYDIKINNHQRLTYLKYRVIQMPNLIPVPLLPLCVISSRTAIPIVWEAGMHWKSVSYINRNAPRLIYRDSLARNIIHAPNVCHYHGKHLYIFLNVVMCNASN